MRRSTGTESDSSRGPLASETRLATDVYFSADVETDGPIPGPYSMLSFALVPAGRFDGTNYLLPANYDESFYAELRPISSSFEAEALAINGLDRGRLQLEGEDPATAMRRADQWVRSRSVGGNPILIAYPLSFDWSWLYWYFVHFTGSSPFNHSRCFDLKTAVAMKLHLPISLSSRDRLPDDLRSVNPHSHHALDDAKEQAEIFSRLVQRRTN